MEIEDYDYLRNQSRLVSKLREITEAVRDIMLVLDDQLCETIDRRNTTAYSLADLLSNTLHDYEDELEMMRKSAIRDKYQKEE